VSTDEYRLPGWESRLAALIETARSEPYELGRHDCFRLACASIEALTGIDHWPRWAGRYGTRRDALKLIAEFHREGFTAAASKLFGREPVAPLLARRGDIVELVQAGEQHLGVAVGAEAAVLGEAGLAFIPLSECAHCWRIG